MKSLGENGAAAANLAANPAPPERVYTEPLPNGFDLAQVRPLAKAGQRDERDGAV